MTFFIAALLAAKHGRSSVLAGSTSALTFMTAVSVGIGAALNRLPSAFTARGGRRYPPLRLWYQVHREDEQSSASANEGELSEAERVVDDPTSCAPASAAGTAAAGSGTGDELAQNATRGPRLAAIAVAFSLTFAAECGDQSMLATVELGVARSPLDVFVRATAGHAIATLFAVHSGHLLSKRLSSRAMSFASGCLFVALGVGTAVNLV